MSGKLTKGTQIAYIPSHTKGNINHPDTEFGFIMKAEHTELKPPATIFCRYWLKGKVGKKLRTTISEATPHHLLIAYESVPQERVNEIIEIIEKGGNPND